MTDWTDERVATLRRMWSEGATYTEIGAVLKISRSCVAGKRKRLALPPKGEAAFRALTTEERAERERVVREVHASGGMAIEAARKLGCGKDAIHKIAKRLGLNFLPRNGYSPGPKPSTNPGTVAMRASNATYYRNRSFAAALAQAPDQQLTDGELIEKAIAEGKLTKVPPGSAVIPAWLNGYTSQLD